MVGVSAGLVGCGKGQCWASGVCGRVGRVWESEKGVWEVTQNLFGECDRHKIKILGLVCCVGQATLVVHHSSLCPATIQFALALNGDGRHSVLHGGQHHHACEGDCGPSGVRTAGFTVGDVQCMQYWRSTWYTIG